MAKANQRSGWRKSSTRKVPTTTNQFGQVGRERRKLLFRVSMLASLAAVLAVVLFLVLMNRPDRDVPLILSFVTRSGARPAEGPLHAAPNAYAAEDVELLTAWFRGNAGDPSQNVRLHGNPGQAAGSMEHDTGNLIAALTGPLASAKPGGPDGDMIAMYLCAHGFVDNGIAYLAVGDSRADKDQTWIKFQDLYSAIVAELQKRFESDLKVVLFIDAARSGPQWDWGQFSETFNETCARTAANQSSQIALILSSSPGERSWWDPRQGNGLFTQALVQAFAGQSDQDGDGIVTVGEIAAYLRSQVDRMARANWDVRQTPMLVGEQAKAWRFIRQPVEVTPPATSSIDIPSLRADFESVDQLWQRHDALARQTHPPLAFNPLAWSTLEKKLARLDALLLAGKDYQSQFTALRSSCESDLTQFENGSNTIPPADALPELAMRDYFHEPIDPSPAIAETVAQWRKKPEIAAVQVSLDEADATRFLLPWIEDNDFNSSSLKLASELLESKGIVSASAPADLLEPHWIRMLSSDDLSHADANVRRAVFISHDAVRRTICADDLRAYFWIRQRLKPVNEQRMRCLDQMLSKNTDDRAIGSDRLRREVIPALDALREKAARISAAYRLRDNMLHEIPRVAETLMTDLEAFKNHEQFEDSRSDVVVKRAIESLMELVKSLRLPADDDPTPIAQREQSIFAATAKAERAYDDLFKRITDRVNDATDESAGDARGLRQNLALLVGSGAGGAERRRRIHRRLIELIEDKNAGITAIQSERSNQTAPRANRTLASMAINGRHVWEFWLAESVRSSSVDLVAAEPTDSNLTPDQLAKLYQKSGAQFRRTVAQLAEGRLSETTEAAQVLEDPKEKAARGATLASTRRLIDHWDTFLRSHTILFSHSPRVARRIGQGRFALDQQLFLFDHAARTMDEFWCAARGGDPPFFVDASRRLLASRDGNPVFADLPLMIDGQSLDERLRSSEIAALSPETLRPRPSSQNQGGTLLKFVAGKSVDFMLQTTEAVPNGDVSIWAVFGDQAKTVAIDEPVTSPLRVSLVVPEDLPASLGAFQSGVFFRGLRRDGEININQLQGGKRTVFRLPRYDAPAVRVVRERVEPERLLLVLDCSRSMRAEDVASQSRLRVAQEAIFEFLNNMDSDVEIGLILFGDRYGFEEETGADGKNQIFPVRVGDAVKLPVQAVVTGQIKDFGLIVANEDVAHNPNFDVRIGVPVNPLDERQLEQLKTELSGLVAIGTTPTYQAILKAYEHLGRQGGHIIVLTDGKPNVVSTKGIAVEDQRQSAIDLAAKRQSDVRLTIVKYLDTDTQLSKDFPDADVLDAANGRDLIRHLQSVRLQPEVYWQRNREAISRRGRFGQLVAIDQWPPTGSAVRPGQLLLPAESVSVKAVVPDSRRPIDESAAVRVSGGEQFEMILSESRLSHRPFDYGAMSLQRINAELSDAGRFRVTAGPVSGRDNRQLTVRLAIESVTDGRSNGRFTPRPSDIWIELTGNDRRDNVPTGSTFSFSMPEFASDQPLPILLCRMDDFPDEFDQVQIKAWMRFGDTVLPGIEVPTSNTDWFRSDQIAGVSFRSESNLSARGGLRLVVTEQYDESREPGAIRVLPTPMPDEASVVTYPAKRVVVRTFDFSDADAEVTLSAVPKEDIQSASTLSAAGTINLDVDSR